MKRVIISLLTLVVFSASSNGQTLSPTPSPSPQAASPSPQPTTQGKVTICPCLQPAIDAIQKAYASLEEDEWKAAIKTATDAQTAIANLGMTCMCPDVAVYQNVASGFLNYAKGGNILDGEDEPNCMAALKLYEDAIKLLNDSISKIAEQDVKSNVGNIRDYCKEELDFVKDECQNPQ